MRLKNGTFPLRLTMGGLAELSIRLGASGPTDLADALRKADPTVWHGVLEVLLGDFRDQATGLGDQDLAAHVPAMVRVFEGSFA